MATMPRVIGGRYGLVLQGIHPAMVKAVFDELSKDKPKNHFTVGIVDDVTHTSLDVDSSFMIESDKVVRAMFFGLGADGTVGANKNSIKIIGDDPGVLRPGYFVYDSKKSGSQTVSHLRFGPDPIRSPYLVQSANFIGCHQFNFLDRGDVLKNAAPGAVFLLNTSPREPEEAWDRIPRPVQAEIIAKKLKVYAINAEKVARDNGMGTRINTIMQTCFFAISGVLPRDKAIDKIKYSIKKSYMRKGEEVVRKNFEAVDNTLANLREIPVPTLVTSTANCPPTVSANAPDFVQRVTAMMMAGRGDELPVSALPVDGTYPSATTQWEKRNISSFVPVWEPDICIQCGNCSMVCPHGVIRSKFYNEASWKAHPPRSRPRRSTPGASRKSATPCKSIWKTAPVAVVRRGLPGQEQGTKSAAKPSTWRPRNRCWKTRRPISASSRPCRKWIAGGWISPPCAACNSCRRCSNSPAPAPVAAKPPTSKCCRNCSAIGCWWPTRPDAPRSTAAICQPLRGRLTTKDAARPGPTRCSRITPSLVWASAWPPTNIWPSPMSCCTVWPGKSAQNWWTS
jgi:Pyruvate/2-oxoacid:ferredoxin oxidoreductase gamma subunit/NAD-dependent dihydropyrimidine dehydrogenase PreA subunit